ncbi:type II toxin-antitoxin system VapC family toxin [Streptomyces sp. MS19]|uniref:type II toxin-antitoxin system VapC family toxin n=1 Tax=Streptomyces sp. MS19 TaxID=3385972 RepID=UPI0039A190EA
MIVIDSSAVIMFLTDSGAIGRQIRARGSRVRASRHDSRHENGVPMLDRTLLDEHIKTYSALRVERHEAMPLLPRVRVLHANLSAYDATYVALAEALGVPFLTTDARIKRGVQRPRCEIDVIGVEKN